MANQALFQASGAGLPATDTVNEAGGRAYALGARHALVQYAVTGCFNGTYYATAAQQLDQVLKLCGQVEPAFIAKTAVYCRERGFMKDMPAFLCAVLATRSPALLQQVFPRVCDDGRMVRNFVQILRSGAVGRRSLGSVAKRLVQNWLATRTDDQLLRASVGTSPSLADIVKMVHPHPATAGREAFYAWLLGREYRAEALPEGVAQFESFKLGETRELPDLPFQMLTALDLGEADWIAIARRAPWQTTRMNLNTFARHGVFKHAGVTREIAARLADPAMVRRSRVFPYQLMAAFKQVGEGVPQAVREALQDAMEVAVANVPAFDGNVVVCPDVSGSMQSPVTGTRKGATSAIRCLDVAALVTAAVLRQNRSAKVLPFSDAVVPVKLNPRDSVMSNAERLASLPSGGTNCSAPLAELNARNSAVDLVILVSDNMSWVDSAGGGRTTATMSEWAAIRRRNPQARLVCLDIQPNGSTQAKERADILNVGGFSDVVFEIVAAFARGELDAGHWVGLIEAVQL